MITQLSGITQQHLPTNQGGYNETGQKLRLHKTILPIKIDNLLTCIL